MANYWAIAIGINQYRCFQPLMYAQRDAQELWNYWVTEGGFDPDHCALLTDGLDPDETIAADTSRDHLASTIVRMCHQLQPDDVFWIFFSGYGVQVQGKDYLMPQEGNPTQVEATGLPIESVFTTLKASPTSNILLILDANRSQGTFESEGFGQETIALAHQYGIATILSCLPDQFSHETLALRQGLFTTALLEGLRYHGCSTVTHLVQYLGERLPALSDHCWRPRQHPLAMIPATLQHQLMIPQQVRSPVGAAVGGSRSTADDAPSLPPTVSPTLTEALSSASTIPFNGAAREFNGVPSIPSNGTTGTGATSAAVANGQVVLPDNPAADEATDDRFWQTWTPIILGAVSILILAVLVLNRTAFNHQENPAVAPVNPGSSAIAPAGGVTGATTNYITDPVAPSPNTTASLETAIPSEADDGRDAIPAPSGDAASTPVPFIDANPSASDRPFISTGESAADLIIAQVQQALQARRYTAASQLLNQLPANQRPANYTPLLQQTNEGLYNEAQITISRPRQLTATNQASDFNAAIQLASQIRQGQPLYEEAQQAIDSWSRTILELAKSRAAQPNRGSSQIAAQNYRAAIQAAKLVPTSRPQLANASQQLIRDWSQTILNLAKSRATEGRLDVAVRTAQAVPPNTPAFADAQRAIAQWQAQQRAY